MLKTVAPHMFVLARSGVGGHGYIVSLGDPRDSRSTLKRMFRSKQELRDWVRDEVGTSVSADHVVDTTGMKLVPKEYSKFYEEVIAMPPGTSRG